VEQLSQFSVPHGLGVAIGMNTAGLLAEKMQMWSPEENTRQKNLLQSLQMPISIPAGFSSDALLEVMRSDKKNDSSGIRLVLPEKIGSARTVSGIPESLIKETLERSYE
jgi:3-dehydroquinate synthase